MGRVLMRELNNLYNMTDPHTPRLDILYVITKSNWGGAQKYVYDCATYANVRHAVGVARGGDGILKERLTDAGIPVFPIKAFQRDISLGKEFASAWELFKLFRTTRPSIVHLNSSKAGGLGAFVAHLAGVPNVVFTSHGLTFEEDRVWWQKLLITFLTWLTFMLSNKVIFVSAANYRSASKMPLIGDRPILVRIGVASPKPLARVTARKKLEEKTLMPPLARGTIWIGTIAELHPNKGLSHLIDGIRELRAIHGNIVCVIIGNDGGLRETLEAQIVDAGLTAHVFLTGTIPDAATYLSAFDIFTLTSLKEGLPIALLEAGNAALPCVGSAIPGIQEVITDMESGIVVQAKRPKEIAGALALLIEDKDRREAYGKALHERVTRDFSIDRMLTETDALYQSLI